MKEFGNQELMRTETEATTGKREGFSLMKRLRLESESGFTLIELLVVVAIIGILAAIAIPQFSAYRKRGYEAQVKSDLRNAATAEEAYFTQYFHYFAGDLTPANTLTGFNKSTQVTPLTAATAGSGFTITAGHSNCAAGDAWTFTSSSGQITGGPCT